MRVSNIEAWALSIIDRVERGEKVEDSRVELKGTWPSPEKAARRIAGHANAARGEPILWLIGVDEDQGVQGIRMKDLADWWSQVTKQFDGLPPDVQEINVPTPSGTVLALFIETTRAPFVVVNPSFGTTGGGPIQREVPWRDKTATRSATRGELIRVLVPLSRLPHIEILDGEITLNTAEGNNQGQTTIRMQFYVTPRSDELLVIPYHRCAAYVLDAEGVQLFEVGSFDLAPEYEYSGGGAGRILGNRESRSLTIDFTRSELLITGPGLVTMSTFVKLSPSLLVPHEVLGLKLTMQLTAADEILTVTSTLKRTTADRTGIVKWATRDA